MFKIIAKLFQRDLYPELKKAGGLGNALNVAFESIGSTLRVADHSTVRNGNKFCPVHTAAEEKLYILDFWRDGVLLAHAKTNNIIQVAKAIDHWLNQNVSTLEFSRRFSFVQATGKAQAFDENREVEFTWNLLAAEDDSMRLKAFIDLARQHEVLSKLFPFTSLSTLCFSKCTGYPFDTADLPEVTSLEHLHIPLSEVDNVTPSNAYVVTKNRTQYIGHGNAEEALKIVCDNLPKHIGPARKGTTDEM